MTSPLIKELKWGIIKVTDAKTIYKDAKLWPGGSTSWDWNDTGTRHSPGVQPADIDQILSEGVEFLVISRGMQLVLQVPQSTIDYATKKGVEVTVLSTEDAKYFYNHLASEGKRVGGIFHSTC